MPIWHPIGNDATALSRVFSEMQRWKTASAISPDMSCKMLRNDRGSDSSKMGSEIRTQYRMQPLWALPVADWPSMLPRTSRKATDFAVVNTNNSFFFRFWAEKMIFSDSAPSAPVQTFLYKARKASSARKKSRKAKKNATYKGESPFRKNAIKTQKNDKKRKDTAKNAKRTKTQRNAKK